MLELSDSEELFQEVVDHLETALESTKGLKVSSKIGFANEIDEPIRKTAKSKSDKKCVEIKAEYEIVTKIYKNFNEFSEANQILVNIDNNIKSMLKRVKRWGIEYGVKKYIISNKIVYIIRAFVLSDTIDTKSKVNITRNQYVEYFDNVLKKHGLGKRTNKNIGIGHDGHGNLYYTAQFRDGKLYIFNVYMYGRQVGGKSLSTIIDDIIKSENNNPDNPYFIQRYQNNRSDFNIVISRPLKL